MLKEKNPSAMEGIISTSKALVMVDIVNRSSREETTFEMRRANCFLHPVVMTNFVAELSVWNGQPKSIHFVYKFSFSSFGVDHHTYEDRKTCFSFVAMLGWSWILIILRSYASTHVPGSRNQVLKLCWAQWLL